MGYQLCDKALLRPLHAHLSIQALLQILDNGLRVFGRAPNEIHHGRILDRLAVFVDGKHKRHALLAQSIGVQQSGYNAEREVINDKDLEDLCCRRGVIAVGSVEVQESDDCFCTARHVQTVKPADWVVLL